MTTINNSHFEILELPLDLRIEAAFEKRSIGGQTEALLKNTSASYEDINVMLLRLFPISNTSIKCVRWYANKMKNEKEIEMPQRPRSRRVSKKSAEFMW